MSHISHTDLCCRDGGVSGYRGGYPFPLNIGRAAGQHMIQGYEPLDYDGETGEPGPRGSRRQQAMEFDTGYNLTACNSYSPPGPEMGSYSARTVVTYQTHIETGNTDPGRIGLPH